MDSQLSRDGYGERMNGKEHGFGRGKDYTNVSVAACSEKYNKFLTKLVVELHNYQDS